MPSAFCAVVVAPLRAADYCWRPRLFLLRVCDAVSLAPLPTVLFFYSPNIGAPARAQPGI
eukprot:5157889-Alexandrium_andersonii.AAC.1